MKPLYLYLPGIPAVISLLMLAGCQQKTAGTPEEMSAGPAKEKEELMVVSNAVEAEKAKPFDSYSYNMRKLVLGYDGVVRHVNLGMTKEQILAIEKAMIVGQNKKSITYKDSISPQEYVDIEYYFNKEGAADAISLHIFLDNRNAYDDVLFELNEFFTRKYGKPIISKEHDEIWKPTPQHEIDIRSVSKQHTYEIEVEVE